MSLSKKDIEALLAAQSAMTQILQKALKDDVEEDEEVDEIEEEEEEIQELEEDEEEPPPPPKRTKKKPVRKKAKTAAMKREAKPVPLVRKKKSKNPFEDMKEFRMHKDDVAIDRKLNKYAPTERGRPVPMIKVVCRSCGKREEVNKNIVLDVKRYKCNDCAGSGE